MRKMTVQTLSNAHVIILSGTLFNLTRALDPAARHRANTVKMKNVMGAVAAAVAT
jgi:hypothetical protein